jgi:hypothetical protein
VKQVEMPDLRTEMGFCIPGGWKAWVPDFFASTPYMRALTEALRKDYPEPEREARARIQQFCEIEYLSRLKDFIKRNGDAYGKRWRDKVGIDKVLIGFDPEALQTRFIPGNKSAGNRPKTNVVNAMKAMAESA